jgi:aminoglycoside phosphotransferase
MERSGMHTDGQATGDSSFEGGTLLAGRSPLVLESAHIVHSELHRARHEMATATVQNPISDLTYDWLTVLQSKAEGLNAYEKYIRDAEKENAQECVQLLRKLHEQDARQVGEIREHLMRTMSKQPGK